MKKMLVCLAVVGLLSVCCMEASAFSSHNWRAWAATTGYADGKCAADCYGGNTNFGYGCGMWASGLIGGVVNVIIGLPMCILNGIADTLICSGETIACSFPCANAGCGCAAPPCGM